MKTFSIDGASDGSGWGVAKVGSVTVVPRSSVTVSIADLGIASINDYIVLFYGDEIESSGYNNNTNSIIIRNKTTQSFDLSCPGSNPNSIPVDYAVIAKGYGSGGGSGH